MYYRQNHKINVRTGVLTRAKPLQRCVFCIFMLDITSSVGSSLGNTAASLKNIVIL